MVFGTFYDKTLFVCIETFGLLEEEFKEYVGGNLKDLTVLDAFDSLFLNGKANQEAQFSAVLLPWKSTIAICGI